MVMTTLSIADDPFRSPSWRWQWANGFDQLYSQRPAAEDPWVARAKRYVAAASEEPFPPRRGRRRKLDAEIERALAIRLDDDRRHRSLLESHLLTGETTASVAVWSGLLPDVVECYSQLFFDVRDRLDDDPYIMARAIEVYRPVDYAEDHPYKLWRALAYKGGVVMLEVFIATSEHSILPVPDEVPDEAAASWWPTQQATCRALIESLLSPAAFERTIFDQLREHVQAVGGRRRRGKVLTSATPRFANHERIRAPDVRTVDRAGKQIVEHDSTSHA